MSEENIDINLNTVVNRESLDELNGDLTALETKEWEVAVNSDGFDEFGNKVDEAGDGVDRLKDDMDSMDGGGAQEASNDIQQVGTSATDASGAVTDLTNILNLIGGAVATGGIVAGIDAVVSSADSADLSIYGMQQALNLDSSQIDVVNDKISRLADLSNASKGQIRYLFSQFGIGGIKSSDTLQSLTEDLTAFSVIAQKDFYTIGNGLSKAFISSTPNRAFRTLGLSVGEVAAKAGMTEDSFNDMWAAATPEERAGMFDEYIRSSYDVVGINQKLSDSYTTLKQNFDDKMGKLSTAFGKMILPLIMPALALLVDGFNFLGDVINGLPDWAKIGLGVVILAGAFALIGIILWTSVIPAVTSAIIGFLNMIPGMLGVAGAAVPTTMGMAGVSAAFWSAAAAVWAFIAPLLPFIAIGLAVAGVIYLIGQYFGWWKDIPTMFEAIKAGVMRLWDAFVNNKHVQAVIAWLQAAWQGVMTFLQPIFDWIIAGWNSLFPPQEGGFDIVQQIINLFGWLGDCIAAVIAFVQANWPIVQMVLSPVLIPLRAIISVIQLIYSNWGRITSWFQVGANTIKGAINALLAPFVSFASGVMNAYNTYIAPVINWIADGIGKLKEFLGLQGQAAGGAAGGGGLSAAGGLLMDEYQDISYPTSNTYNIYLNGLVTEQSIIDELLRLIQIGEEQEEMRV